MSGTTIQGTEVQVQTVKIFFDGGNGARAYGSYEIQSKELTHKGHRLDFGPHSTCNIAEYLSLIAALRWLRHHTKPLECRLEIWGDSQLVVYQVRGRWKCRVNHLKGLRDEVLSLLEPYRHWQISWHPRKNSVRLFGH